MTRLTCFEGYDPQYTDLQLTRLPCEVKRNGQLLRGESDKCVLMCGHMERQGVHGNSLQSETQGASLFFKLPCVFIPAKGNIIMDVLRNYVAPSCALCTNYTGPKKTKWCMYCYKTICYDCVPSNAYLDIRCFLCKEPSINFCSNECRGVVTTESGLALCATEKCMCNCFFKSLERSLLNRRA